MGILKHKKITYDITDLLIIEGLGKYGPRNIRKIAMSLDLPDSTVRYRISSLVKKGLLRLYTNIYHTYIGLKKHIVLADVNPLYAGDIGDFFGIVDFWIYLKKVRGPREKFLALYLVPPEHSDDLDEFLREMVDLDIIYNYKTYFSTCFHNINPTVTWYDLNKNEWIYDWDSLPQEIEEADMELPYTLKDPEAFPLLADTTDIMILKELEKNPTVSYGEIAEMIGSSPQNVYYHYKYHIEKRKLIEDFQIFILKHPLDLSIFPYFVIEFTNYLNFAKATNVFRNKPYAQVMGKILGENKLFMHTYLPITEYINMLETLNNLVSLGYIKDYEYYVSYPLDYARRQTISYRNFKGDGWIYHHDEYMDALYNKYREVRNKLKPLVN